MVWLTWFLRLFFSEWSGLSFDMNMICLHKRFSKESWNQKSVWARDSHYIWHFTSVCYTSSVAVVSDFMPFITLAPLSGWAGWAFMATSTLWGLVFKSMFFSDLCFFFYSVVLNVVNIRSKWSHMCKITIQYSHHKLVYTCKCILYNVNTAHCQIMFNMIIIAFYLADNNI